jgi:hypothetical protein
MKLCQEINSGFTALGASRILPPWLQVLVRGKVDRHYKYTTFTVRDIQYAVLNLGYTVDKILASETLTKASDGPDPNLAIRHLKRNGVPSQLLLCHSTMRGHHGIPWGAMSHYMNGASYMVGDTQQISIHLTIMVRNFGGDVFCDSTHAVICDLHNRR